jgi:hypothetical protein
VATPITRPADLVRTTVQFNMHQASAVLDVAEFDMWWQVGAPTTPASWPTFLTELSNACAAAWIAEVNDSFFPNSLSLKGVVASRCDDVGHVVDEQVHVSGPTDYVGTGENSLPWQLANAVGLYSYQPGTFIANQRRKRGRIFLPPQAASELNDPDTGEMAPALATAIAEAINNYIVAVQSATYSGPPTVVPGPVVLSLGPYTTAGSPAVYPVTWVRTDSVWDTQRRRRKELTSAVNAIQILGHIG